jgi:hypothetical protein
MMPAPSLWGTMRGNGMTLAPARDFTSEGFTPDYDSLTRTSPGPGAGVGNSSNVKTSLAGPGRE